MSRCSITLKTLPVLVLVLALCPSACSPDSSTEKADRLASKPASRHAVHSERLQKIMSQLGRQAATQWPQEVEDLKAAQEAEDNQTRFRRAKSLADALGQAADAIPEAVAEAPLTEAQRVAFMAGVDELRVRATDLEAAAAAQNLSRMEAALSKVKMTCYGCHAQFSEYTGPLDFGG